jgi:hypothetical protein
MTAELQKQRLAQRRRRIRLAIIGLSVGAGLLCNLLPEQYHGACRFASKLVALFGGGG